MRWKRLSALEKVATQVGLEPTVGRLTADCINHYATESGWKRQGFHLQVGKYSF